FDAFRRDDFEAARAHFAAARALPETAEDLLGRASYWHARALLALEREEDAIAAYETLVRSYPLSFYAQQALARLDALAPARAEALRSALVRDAGAPLVFDASDGVDLTVATGAAELLVVGALADAER